jgi:uncharacterized protein YceK
MRQAGHSLFLWILLVLAIGSGGCATIRTMPSLSSPGYPRVYSGARLDFNAMTENEERLKKFKTEAPEYPLIDFPFSLILDTVLLPVILPVTTYELIFG